jgi:hypothetical protein
MEGIQYRHADRNFVVIATEMVRDAFFDLQHGLKNGTLTVDQLDAIDSLPAGEEDRRSSDNGSLLELVEMTGRKRIERFPTGCCADAVAVLGIIFTMLIVNPKEIIEVSATPYMNNPAFNFHKWLKVDGIVVDITLGQFHPLGETVGNTVAFATHPFEPDEAYKLEEKQFVPPTTAVKFAEHIFFSYIANKDSKEVKLPPAAKQIGRNQPCPCGSGKKYKRCCGKETG